MEIGSKPGNFKSPAAAGQTLSSGDEVMVATDRSSKNQGQGQHQALLQLAEVRERGKFLLSDEPLSSYTFGNLDWQSFRLKIVIFFRQRTLCVSTKLVNYSSCETLHGHKIHGCFLCICLFLATPDPPPTQSYRYFNEALLHIHSIHIFFMGNCTLFYNLLQIT